MTPTQSVDHGVIYSDHAREDKLNTTISNVQIDVLTRHRLEPPASVANGQPRATTLELAPDTPAFRPASAFPAVTRHEIPDKYRSISNPQYHRNRVARAPQRARPSRQDAVPSITKCSQQLTYEPSSRIRGTSCVPSPTPINEFNITTYSL